MKLQCQCNQFGKSAADFISDGFVVKEQKSANVVRVIFHRASCFKIALIHVAIIMPCHVEGFAVPRENMCLEFGAGIAHVLDAGAVNRFSHESFLGLDFVKDWQETLAENVTLSNSAAKPPRQLVEARTNQDAQEREKRINNHIWAFTIGLIIGVVLTWLQGKRRGE